MTDHDDGMGSGCAIFISSEETPGRRAEPKHVEVVAHHELREHPLGRCARRKGERERK